MGPRDPAASAVPRLDSGVGVHRVALRVRDIAQAQSFYTGVVGLIVLETEPGRVLLGAPGAGLVELLEDPGATPRDPQETGLFHLAIRVPTRADLARVLAGLLQSRWPLAGASDHLVSEALYLSDPEGNGIEVYRDRPRNEWPRGPRGELQMATLALDLHALLDSLDGEDVPQPALPPGTDMGHVHLQVADLAASERFYVGALGLEVSVADYPGALFVAGGGYHHHVGLNIWNSRGGRPPGARSSGLVSVTLAGLPDLDGLPARAAEVGAEVREDATGLFLSDPAGNTILATAS
jgi:catechol 2,3-dioxygenase